MEIIEQIQRALNRIDDRRKVSQGRPGEYHCGNGFYSGDEDKLQDLLGPGFKVTNVFGYVNVEVIKFKPVSEVIADLQAMWSAKDGEATVYGRTYQTVVFENADSANRFMEANREYGMILEDDNGVHCAKLSDKGRKAA